MATQRDIKRRIDSVRNTRKITRAMELVASAKLRRAQDRIESLRPYAQAMRRLMAQAARQSGGAKGLALLEERAAEGTAIVVAITGDRGLAGAFNVNIVRRAMNVADELRAEGFDEVVFTTVGKKGAGTLAFRGLAIDRAYQGFSVEPTFADAEQVKEHLVGRFTDGEVNRVVIVYNAFKSVLEQTVTTEQLLPVERTIVIDEDEETDEDHAPTRGLALFEPDPEEFLRHLLPNYLDTTIYRALLESAAAELAARRTAMRNATDNAGALIDQYTLAMNRARQAAITQEILEVVAGADALT
ncbi:MAG TPA: ATP synthase F1 subunit gamma [Miltoncostaeaceae bacterium]|nr:ATP synthase F1 subunit gamma [Miltoncostaeaceae bacterium]